MFTQTSADDDIEHKCETGGPRRTRRWTCAIIDPDRRPYLRAGRARRSSAASGYNVMKGYYKMPEATAEAIDADGYLHSGDLGTVDEDGYYRVTGRIKDMIIRGGENIYPLEVENFLLTHARRAGCAGGGHPRRAPTARSWERSSACAPATTAR